MADKKQEQIQEVQTGAVQSEGKKWNPNRRYWQMPKNRGKKYAEERKAGVFTSGDNEGKPLSEYDKGVRSGYLQCQSDHAGAYTYKTVADETQGTNNQKRHAGAVASRDKHYWKKRKAAKQQNN